MERGRRSGSVPGSGCGPSSASSTSSPSGVGSRSSRASKICRSCGQTHGAHEPHLYDYAQEVDEDLTCHICLQPFVEPVDTPCGHTFCHVCLGAFLRLQQLCPIDRKPLADHLCTSSSLVLRKLLEKLTVSCPNVEVCNAVIPRGDLGDHLEYRCPATQTGCKFSTAGCPFKGPQRSVLKHQEECSFRETGITRLPVLEGEISHIEIPRTASNLGIAIVGGADTPLRCVVVQEVFPTGLIAQDGRLQPGDQLIEINGMDMTHATHHQACQALRKMYPLLRLGVYRERIEAYNARSSNHYVEEVRTVTLEKQLGQPLGVRLSGRRSEPGIYIMEILEGSTAAQNGQLEPNDHILSVNGEDVRTTRLEHASHLIQSADCITLVVARKKLNPSRHSAVPRFPTQEEETDGPEDGHDSEQITINHVRAKSAPDTLISAQPTQNHNQQNNNINNNKLHATRNACHTNGQANNHHPEQLRHSNQEWTLTPCKATEGVTKSGDESGDSLTRSQSCEALDTLGSSSSSTPKRHSSGSPVKCNDVLVALPSEAACQLGGHNKRVDGFRWQHKNVTIHKDPDESLGMRIGGGLGSNEGDTPIYIANIHPQGCVGKSRQIRKGDILLSVNGSSLLGLTHSQAVANLKATVDKASVSLGVLEGPETTLGASNFVPSWLYWQRLPRCLHFSKTVVLQRSPGASLGFSIVGGADPARGAEPIHVLYVVHHSPAANDGRLKCGDRLLAVDGYSLENVKHSTAVSLLKQTGTRVQLEVVSWMGTEV